MGWTKEEKRWERTGHQGRFPPVNTSRDRIKAPLRRLCAAVTNRRNVCAMLSDKYLPICGFEGQGEDLYTSTVIMAPFKEKLFIGP